MAPEDTIDRVERAEEDLATASEGITDQTPLTEAGAQFNAAAFALEVAWLRLFADAGCLSDEQQAEAVAALAEYTTALQTGLQTAGYYDGEIDGVYGPATVEAVEALQTDADLPVTGYVDRATAAALDGHARGGGRRGRDRGRRAHRRRAVDAQARRLLDRARRRHLDPRADRGADGVPDRPRGHAER